MRQWLGAAALALAAMNLGACKVEVAGGQADGEAIYVEVCARCHGIDGAPEPIRARQLGVRDLRDPGFQAGITDDALRTTIAGGTPSRRMPAFEGALTPAQLDAVTRYVRTLGARP